MDTVDFATGAKGAGTVLDDLAARIEKFAFSWKGALSVAVASAVGLAWEVRNGLSKALEEIGDIGKTAQKIGLTAEALSQLQYAANRSGVASETFATSIKKLSVNLQDVLKNGSSEAATAIKVLGVSVTDTHGKLKSTADILPDIADKFASYKDSANKTAIAVALFGRNGSELIPFLNKGSEGIERLRDKADELGYTVNDSTIKAVKELNKHLRDISDRSDGWYRQLVSDLAPALLDVVKTTESFADKSGVAEKSITATTVATKLLAETYDDLSHLAQIALASIKGLTQGTLDLTALDFSSFKTGLEKTLAEVDAIITDQAAHTAKRWDLPNQAVLESAATHARALAGMSIDVKGWAASVENSTSKVKESLDAPSLARSKISEALETITKQVQGLQALQAATADKPLINLSATVKEDLEQLNKKLVVTQALATQLQGLPKLNQDPAAALVLEQYNKALAYGKQLADEYATPLEKIEKAQAKINEAWRVGAINQDTYSRAMQDNSVYSQKNLLVLAETTVSTLDKIFGQTKAVAIATALVNTYKGVTAALEYPPPMSFAMAGLQLAAGMAQVANIRSTTSAGGGGGGSTAAASSAPAAGVALAGAAATAPASTQSLLVQGISPSGIFTGDVVRDLAQKLVDFQKDGGKVVLA